MRKYMWIAAALVVAAVLAAVVFTGAEEVNQLGCAVITDRAGSRDAGTSPGTAKVSSVAVAVLTDARGRILRCAIDQVDADMGFTALGALTQDAAGTEFLSKQALKGQYGMSAVSSLGTDWYQQANALADYVKGMTAREVAAIPLKEDGAPAGADLWAGATLNVSPYIQGILASLENLRPSPAGAGDELGLGIYTHMNQSKAAGEGALGQAQAYSTYALATFDRTGMITDCVLDSTQGAVEFDRAGKIAGDIRSAVPTKRQLGDGYGMKAASGIGREWYEQADAFAAYCRGRTAAQVADIPVDGAGRADGADVRGSVTISLTPFQRALALAWAQAGQNGGVAHSARA